jgi:hypothetical protein
MKESFRPDLKAHVLTDDANRVRAIRHSKEYWESPEDGERGGLATAAAYLKEFAPVFGIEPAALASVDSKVSYLEPGTQEAGFRLCEEKRQFDSETFGFCQTWLNLPVWRAGLKVVVKQAPGRVVSAENTSQPGVDARLPSSEAIERFRKVFLQTNAATVRRRAVQAQPELRAATRAAQLDEPDAAAEREGQGFVRKLLSIKKRSKQESTVRLIRGRFWVYRYDADERLPPADDHSSPPARKRGKSGGKEMHGPHEPMPFEVPAVSARIKDGAWYVVAEITFEVVSAEDRHTWRVLVELETGSVLYLRPLFDNVSGMVYASDPITTTGTTVPASNTNNATLNPHRDDVVLQNLAGPIAGTQSLAGAFAEVTQVEGDNIAPPTQPSGVDFDYDARTNNFASVSGYFHTDRIFRTMQDLGFDVGTYMSNTVFPVPVDIRCFNIVNAHCVGDGMGGIGHAGYGLMDSSLPGDPLGRACDPRVHLHEVLGHGILYEAVDSPNMGFTHSAGDSLSLIYFDPDSNCKGVDGTPLGKPGDLRFTYVPWHPSLNRRCDRNVADGWAWNGSRDDGGYGSEEILATTLFNFYRSIGGDSADAGRRRFASRMAMYLVLRGIGDLTPATDPQYAREFAAALMATDALNWTSEGVYGGAYHKVIRWAFEKQGEFQTPLVTNGSAADGTIVTAGDPPEVDVYIDDGRAGEYPYQPVHWHATTLWNRRAPDGIDAHQEPELGSTNYAYVKIRNRGTQTAQNVVVSGFHSKPGAGLTWPTDFAAFTTPPIYIGNVNGNDSQEVVAGPFEWEPNTNAFGHDCMLMVVAADGDESNVANFTVGETIPEWRLVPNDNNIAQRNVVPVPGKCGKCGLMQGLDGKKFLAGNPNPRRGKMSFRVHLPPFLEKLGWKLELQGVEKGMVLASGAKREVTLKLHAGQEFSPDDVRGARNRDIRIEVLANDNLVGGMTYRLDPDLCKPWNHDRPKGKDCLKEAQRLADCLGIRQDIGKVCVEEIVVSLKVKKDDCCC